MPVTLCLLQRTPQYQAERELCVLEKQGRRKGKMAGVPARVKENTKDGQRFRSRKDWSYNSRMAPCRTVIWVIGSPAIWSSARI
jgi:hypothetical protein